MAFSKTANYPKQESKVDVQSYVLLSFICPSDFQFCDYTLICYLLFFQNKSE